MTKSRRSTTYLGRGRLRIGTALLCALALAGTGVSQGSAGAATKKTTKRVVKKTTKRVVTTTAAKPAKLNPTIAWAPCGTGLDCGELVVPLDYAHPTAGTVRLGVARRPARVASKRIGVLVVNPGGPAGSAFDEVSSATSIEDYPAVIRDSFDIVGIDPRGVKRSSPVLCAVTPPETRDPVAEASYFAQSCGKRSGSILPFVGTDSSAEDIESLRVALGETEVSFLGFSYGTYLGALFAQAHPTSVRAMLLDGAMDPTRFGLDSVIDQLLAQERALNAFFNACAATANCGLKADGKSPKQRFEELLLISSRTGIGPEKITRDELEVITGRLLGISWSTLSTTLGDLNKGGTDMSLALLDYFGGDSSKSYEDGSFEAIACRDGMLPSSHPEDAASPEERLARYQAVSPHFQLYADYWASDATCTGWPSAPRAREAVSTTAGDRIVVVGNTLDMRTPYEWSVGLAKQLHAPLVTFDDYVHTATLSGETCITSMMTSWLVSRTKPAADLVC